MIDLVETLLYKNTCKGTDQHIHEQDNGKEHLTNEPLWDEPWQDLAEDNLHTFIPLMRHIIKNKDA